MTTPRKRIDPPALAKKRKVYDSELVEEEKTVARLPRARTPEAREQQLTALAYDLAEEQLRKGTASSQVMSHFLKIGSSREKIELQKVRQETLLVEAKVKDLANVEELKKLYSEAMDALKGYKGDSSDDSNVF